MSSLSSKPCSEFDEATLRTEPGDRPADIGRLHRNEIRGAVWSVDLVVHRPSLIGIRRLLKVELKSDSIGMASELVRDEFANFNKAISDDLSA